jgi:hypothetical protein
VGVSARYGVYGLFGIGGTGFGVVGDHTRAIFGVPGRLSRFARLHSRGRCRYLCCLSKLLSHKQKSLLTAYNSCLRIG